MTIRRFGPGDDAAQAAIYNEVAGSWPGFKPATAEDVRKRTLSRDFNPEDRIYAVEGGTVVGYCATHPLSGRISYPFCRPGHEGQATTLLRTALDHLKKAGCRRAFAAYRGDWAEPAAFFPAHGLPRVREMHNFLLPLTDLPTLSFKPSLPVTRVERSDIPALRAMVPDLLPMQDDEQLFRYWSDNPYIPPDAMFLLRNRADNSPAAAGLLVCDPVFADPEKLDSAMPCYRYGAFGTEGIPSKRVNGLFSALIPPGPKMMPLFLDLLSHAANRLDDSTVEALAAQVASDASQLVAVYDRHFRRQTGFPVYEIRLT